MGILENSVLLGFNHCVFVKPDGTLWSWGKNSNGQLGLGDTTDRNAPAQVGTDTNWSSAAIGAFHSMAIKTDGTMWAAGHNVFGQLGLGNLKGRKNFIQVGTDADWSSVHPGGFHTLAKKTNDTLYAFGLNNYGQLGLGDTVNRCDPFEIGISRTWGEVSAGVFHSLGIEAIGTLWGWGNNDYFQLGIDNGQAASTAAPHLAPIQVGSAHDWQQIAAGFFHSVAVRIGGTLWGWGDNGAGQLGNSDSLRISVDVPIQIGTDTNWEDVKAGLFFTIAKKVDDALWTVGDNEFGQLGQGATTDLFTLGFAQVGTDTDWVTPAVVGRAHVFATKTSGSAFFAWGRNVEGQVGDGTNTNQNSPVSVAL